MRRLNVRAKLLLATVLLLGNLAVLGGVITVSQSRLSTAVTEVVDDVYPTVINATELARLLDNSVGNLVFYIISTETRYQQEFESNVENIKHTFDTLQANSLIKSNNMLLEMTNKIADNLATFNSEAIEILALTKDTAENFPVRTHARDRIDPVMKTIDEQINVVRNNILAEENNILNGALNLTYKHDISKTEHRKILRHNIKTLSLYSQQMYLVQLLNNYRSKWKDIKSSLTAYVAYRDHSHFTRLEQHLKHSQEILIEIDGYSSILDEKQTSALTSIHTYVPTFKAALAQLVEINQSDKWRLDFHTVKAQFSPTVAKIKKEINKLTSHLRDLGNNTGQNVLAEMKENIRWTMTLVVGGIIIGLIITFVLVRVILTPLNQAVQAMEDIASRGNLSRRLDESGKDEMSVLSGAFNRFVLKMVNVIDLVLQSSTSLAREASTVSSVTGQGLEKVRQQQDKLFNVAIAVSEMSSTLRTISDNTQAAADATEKANRNAENGQKIVRQVVGAINDVALEVHDVGSVVERVSKESENIGEVVSIINEISKQTNLLALNAAIEAARAGESGRGFAVVADEVRTLSKRIQDETHNIHTRIETLKNETSDALDTSLRNKEKTERSVKLAETAGAALESITQSVSTMTEMNQKIAEATSIQNTRADTINHSVVEMQGIAAQAMESVKKASTSGGEFKIMADQLEHLVSKFLMENTGTDPLLRAPESPRDVEVDNILF